MDIEPVAGNKTVLWVIIRFAADNNALVARFFCKFNRFIKKLCAYAHGKARRVYRKRPEGQYFRFFFTVNDFRLRVEDRACDPAVKFRNTAKLRQVFICIAKLVYKKVLVASRTVKVPESAHGH